MNGYELVTWISIVVLVAGSIGAFAWFLRDAVRFLRGVGGRGGESRREE